MSKPPLVSVIIPVHNGAQFLGAALNSILKQTYPHVEIIVIDDGSTDNTGAVARSFGERIKFYSQASQGVWAARNDAIRYSAGDYLLLQDADDLAVPQRAEIQMQAFESDPEAGLVFGHMIEFQGLSNLSLETLAEAKINKIPGYCPGTALVRREVFYRVGEFENEWSVAGFLDWFMKSKELGIKSILTPEILLARRVHGGNSTLLDKGKLPKEYLSVIRANLARQSKKNKN